jgi:hypothetical protein
MKRFFEKEPLSLPSLSYKYPSGASFGTPIKQDPRHLRRFHEDVLFFAFASLL